MFGQMLHNGSAMSSAGQKLLSFSVRHLFSKYTIAFRFGTYPALLIASCCAMFSYVLFRSASVVFFFNLSQNIEKEKWRSIVFPFRSSTFLNLFWNLLRKFRVALFFLKHKFSKNRKEFRWFPLYVFYLI